MPENPRIRLGDNERTALAAASAVLAAVAPRSPLVGLVKTALDELAAGDINAAAAMLQRHADHLTRARKRADSGE